jgi:aminoglycoside phosphotransferase (APT) family kinase protein
MAVDPSQPEQVGEALLAYLSALLGAPGVAYAEPPAEIAHGWETYIFSFKLAGEGLPPEWAQPLILRVYPGTDQGPKAEREAAVQRFVADRGFPAPRPLMVETDLSVLGLPFMVMERCAGETMLDLMTKRPYLGGRFARLMATTHAALHQLPVDGCPLPADGPLVERWARDYQSMVSSGAMVMPEDAEDAFVWLEGHQHVVVPEEVSLCHHDFHPFNLLVDDDRNVVVLDWPGAALGDRHSDIASTLVLLRTAPFEPRNWLEGLLTRFGRGLLVWMYLWRYRRNLPIDRERLRYWEAVHSFQWWAQVATMEQAGSAAMGAKPDTAARVPPDQLDRIRRYFWKRARD